MSIHWSFPDPFTAALSGTSIFEKGYYWLDDELRLWYHEVDINGGTKNRKNLGQFTDLQYALNEAEKDLVKRHKEFTHHNLQD